MAINGLTTQNEPFFNIVRSDFGDRCLNYYDRINLMFHIDHEVTLIQRQVYNSFMLFGDVGGFSGLLIGLGSFIVSFLNFQNAENYVAQFLYKSKTNSEDGDQLSTEDNIEGEDRLDPRKQKSLIEYLQSSLLKCCLVACLRKRRRDRVFERAREKLGRELDLVQLLQQIRFFSLAIDSLLVPAKVNSLRKMSEKVQIELSDSKQANNLQNKQDTIELKKYLDIPANQKANSHSRNKSTLTAVSLKEAIDDHQVTYDGVTEMITSPSVTLTKRKRSSSNEIPAQIFYGENQDSVSNDIAVKVVNSRLDH